VYQVYEENNCIVTFEGLWNILSAPNSPRVAPLLACESLKYFTDKEHPKTWFFILLSRGISLTPSSLSYPSAFCCSYLEKNSYLTMSSTPSNGCHCPLVSPLQTLLINLDPCSKWAPTQSLRLLSKSVLLAAIICPLVLGQEETYFPSNFKAWSFVTGINVLAMHRVGLERSYTGLANFPLSIYCVKVFVSSLHSHDYNTCTNFHLI
jgi:hypothetical protein